MVPSLPDDPPPRAPWKLPAAVVIVVGALVVWRKIVGSDMPPSPPQPIASANVEPAPAPPAPPRCEEVSAEPFMIGDAPAEKPAAPADGGTADPAEDIEDPTVPFAVEVGRGAVFGGGFAVGARRDEKTGAVAMVATLGLDGKGGKSVRLGRLRGDLDPPVVAGAGDAVLAVMVEPNAGHPAFGGGRALKVAKVQGDQVTWGPELPEGRDESQALDVAASAQRAIVVWDDLVGTTDKRSVVMLATIDVATMKLVSPGRAISGANEDAERPRLVARPGGYWLAYAVRGAADAKKKDKKHDDDDERELGETITTSWIALMPLDESGAPTAQSRAVTPKSGHVLGYDLELGDDGGALLAYRDDDTPTGSNGGRLLATLARLGGGNEARVLAEETAAAGMPDLLPGWISLASVNGATRIAALSPRGELLDDLAPEKSLGIGVPVAATRDAILWARPMGKPMRLAVVRCKQRPVEATSDAGAKDASAGDGD
ncbi:Hypothetical protein A7982_10252 [Minicystis rosea]|nr:Hypothetical protein A7982_10252 [Minicystis rosea]